MEKVNIEFNNVALGNIMFMILTELDRAKIKHPIWPTDNVHRASILMEEAGEVVRAANQLVMEGMPVSAELKMEIIQTAAMCIRFLEVLQLDNHGKKKN